MRRLVLLLVLAVPLAAQAKGKKKKKPDPDKVEIWPPPEPVDEDPPKPETKKDPDPEPEPQSSDGKIHLDPSLTGDDGSTPPEPLNVPPDPEEQAPKKAAPEDPCLEPFQDCRDECSIEHATDDTLHVPKGKKLPIAKCLSKCKKKYDLCQERRTAGLDEESKEADPPPGD